MGTAVELAAHEMVPPAIGTDLDEITGELVVGAAELLELGGLRDAAPVGGAQAVAVDV